MDGNVGNGSQRIGSVVGGAPLGAGHATDHRATEHGGTHDHDASVETANAPRTEKRRKRKRLTKGRLTIGTLNMRGGGGLTQGGPSDKWLRVNQLIREGRIAVLALQETHLTQERLDAMNDLFKATMLIVASPDPENPTAARGVAVALNKRLIQTDGIEVREIVPGRALETRIQWTRDRKLTILNVYAPNDMSDNAAFWETLARARDCGRMHAPDLFLGDLNVVRAPLDRLPPRQDNVAAAESLGRLEQRLNLTDGWRAENPGRREYTYLQTSTGSQSRIDRILVNRSLVRQTGNWEIGGPGIATDHRMPMAPHVGRGRWALPADLLTDTPFLSAMRAMSMDFSAALVRLTDRTGTNNPQTAFATFKANLLHAARRRAKEKMPRLDRNITALKVDIESILQRPDLTEEDVRSAAVMRDRLAELEIKRFGTHRERVAANDWMQGETISKYWTRLNAGPRPDPSRQH
ncbi:Endonuclease/exonuclease/phosphatase [Ganoderma leucocontextum]|nr:Endonuclease/exonuclease/phosphatase [Ganoderma leucocontextum]